MHYVYGAAEPGVHWEGSRLQVVQNKAIHDDKEVLNGTCDAYSWKYRQLKSIKGNKQTIYKKIIIYIYKFKIFRFEDLNKLIYIWESKKEEIQNQFIF